MHLYFRVCSFLSLLDAQSRSNPKTTSRDLSKMSTMYTLPSDIAKVKEFEWDDHYDFPRDLIGYGEKSFNPQWPGEAKIAVSFVINYEEVRQYTNSFSKASL